MEAQSRRFFSYNANFDAHLTRGDGRFKAMAGYTHDYGLYPYFLNLAPISSEYHCLAMTSMWTEYFYDP